MVAFGNEIRQRVLEDTPPHDRNSRETLLRVLEEFGERYGRWQDWECRVMKGMLVQMETAGTGRVRLEDFYRNATFNNTWQFRESVPYLRQMGALDESDPRQMKVIIPNYVNAPSNCGAGSKWYSVCCIDECDALLSTLENRISSPLATAATIIEHVAHLPSDTVIAPRNLSATLIGRLQEIAGHHGGVVPLHGRLFGQWMHHAYPRECNYPHVSGTTSPVTILEFMNQGASDIAVTKAEVRKLLEDEASSIDQTHADQEETYLPWESEEELFVCWDQVAQTRTSNWRWSPMIIAVIFSALLVRLRSYAFAGKGLGNERYYV
jgi:hypothetical protein